MNINDPQTMERKTAQLNSSLLIHVPSDQSITSVSLSFKRYKIKQHVL